MDFATLFVLLIPLIALYVRAPSVHVSATEAGSNLLWVALTSAALTWGALFLLRRRAARPGGGERGALTGSRLLGGFNVALAGLFFFQLHRLYLKESFERLCFPSDWFFVSDLALLLPFLVPFLIVRAEGSRLGMRRQGVVSSFVRELLRQLRTTAVVLLPQLLYLNSYRAIVVDVPLIDRLFADHPLLGFVLAGTLLFLIFVFSPLFLRSLFRRVPLEQFAGSEELALQLRSLARRAQVAVRRVLVWVTGDRRVANAAVTGLLSRQRTIFVTDHLLHSLELPEQLAVVAHELGHARLHHLLFNFLLAIASGLFVVWGLALAGHLIESQETLGLTVVVLQLFYILVVFGFFSRRFERQADLLAAHLLGSPRLVGATLVKLAVVNRLAVTRGSITHPSIQSRVQRLAELQARFGQDLSEPLRRAVVANRLLLAVLLLFFGGTAVFLGDFV